MTAGLSPAQIAVKETAEEAGLPVRATRLLALRDRDALTRNTAAQVQRLIALEADPAAPAAFD